MRSATNFTLHAILAACLAAFAASSAAAAPPTGGKEEVYFTITLTDAMPMGRNDGRLQSFEIREWSFDKVSKVDSFTISPAPIGQITFVYGKATVRGWDSEKKEQ